MARDPKPRNAKPGDNSTPTEDELAALQLWHADQVRKAIAARAVTKAKDDEAKKAINSAFTLVRAELQINRVDFEELLAAEDMDESEFLAAEKARAIRFKRQGLPAMQPDLFDGPPKANDTAGDKARVFEMGRKIGLRGGDRTPPDVIATFLQPDWLAGYDAGQKELGEAFIKANEARAKIAGAKEATEAKRKPKLTAVEGGKGKGGDKAKPAAGNTPAPAQAQAETPPDIGGPTPEEMNPTPTGDSEGGQLTGGVIKPAEGDDAPNPLEGAIAATDEGRVEGPFTGTEPAGELGAEEAPKAETSDAEWDEAAPTPAAQAEEQAPVDHPPIGEAP